MAVETTTLDRLAHILASMEQAIQALSRVVQQRPGKMAPWDENAYFLNPAQTVANVSNTAASQIIGANPQRIALLFGTNPGVTIQIGINPNPVANEGFTVSSNFTFSPMVQHEYGSLVTQAWYGINVNAVGTVQITVIEIALREWPQGA